MAQIIKFKSPRVETVVDILNRMPADQLDEVLESLFSTNEDRAAYISRDLEIRAMDKEITNNEGEYYE